MAAIETPRLTLRDWREDDIAPFVRHTNTEPVMRWLGGVKSEVEIRAVIEERLMRWQRERAFTFWAVERKSDAALLGFCGLKLADTPGSPSWVREAPSPMNSQSSPSMATIRSLDAATRSAASLSATSCVPSEKSRGHAEICCRSIFSGAVGVRPCSVKIP